MDAESSRKLSAAVTLALGVAAILLPYLFGTVAVMLLAVVMLASGVVGLLYANALRKQEVSISVFGPWAQVIAGVVVLLWPDLALWLVAVVLGGGLILGGIMGLSALKESAVVNPPWTKKFERWASIALGAILIVMGAAGSALLLGVVLGVALIARGLQQWSSASSRP